MSVPASSGVAPELETERLRFRGHSLADLEDSFSLWSDPLVTRYIGGKPSTREEVWARLLRYVGHWSLLGFGFWLIHEKASGRFVGEVGFLDAKRDIEPSLGGSPEVGWALVPWSHGQGFATEAVRGVLAWGKNHFGSARTVCLIDPSNLPSLRVAANCGFSELVRTTYQGQMTIVLENNPIHNRSV